MITETKTCISEISTDRGWHFHSCGRKAIDGDYCGIHSPTRRKQRRESSCHYKTYGRNCGEPAVTVEYGEGRCEEHSAKAWARERPFPTSAPALLEACCAALAALESPEARHVLAFIHERELLRTAIAQVEEETP